MFFYIRNRKRNNALTTKCSTRTLLFPWPFPKRPKVDPCPTNWPLLTHTPGYSIHQEQALFFVTVNLCAQIWRPWCWNICEVLSMADETYVVCFGKFVLPGFDLTNKFPPPHTHTHTYTQSNTPTPSFGQCARPPDTQTALDFMIGVTSACERL